MLHMKYSNAVLFALFSQHRADGDVAARDVIQSVASSFQLERLQNQQDKIPLGEECLFVPRRTKLYNRGKITSRSNQPDVGILSFSQKKTPPLKTRRHWKNYQPGGDSKGDSIVEPDVGILLSSSNCIGRNDVCQADITSSLGGRCVPSSSDNDGAQFLRHSFQRIHRSLQSESNETDILPIQAEPISESAASYENVGGFTCPATCTNPSFCACITEEEDSDSLDCVSIIASTCRNKEDFANCIPSYFVDLATHYYCVYYQCLDEGKSVPTCLCEVYTATCEFCQEDFAANLTNCMFGNYTYNAALVCGPADCCNTATNDAEMQICFGNDDPTSYSPPGNMTPASPPPTRPPTMEGTEALTCPSTCNDATFCECIFGSGYEDGLDCANTIASSCQRGDFVNCWPPQYETTATYYYCPFWDCLDLGNTESSGICQCAAFASLCEFCKANFADDMVNCATGHPYDAYYDGYSVCMIAGCCANSTTVSDRYSCLGRNETEVPDDSAPLDEIDKNETIPTNQTETERGETQQPLPDGVAQNGTQTNATTDKAPEGDLVRDEPVFTEPPLSSGALPRASICDLRNVVWLALAYAWHLSGR